MSDVVHLVPILFDAKIYTFYAFYRGWNYVECMESITYENSFERDSDCWKLTTFCRDVISTPHMDEFGHGATPDTFAPKGHLLAIVLALVACVLASALVGYAKKGGFFRKRDENFGDVQFSSIRSHGIM